MSRDTRTPARRLAPLFLVLLLVACGGSAPSQLAGDVLLNPPRRPDRSLSQALGPNGHHILYLNFEGVTVSPNYDDSTRNASSIALGQGSSITVPGFNATLHSSTKTRPQVIADAAALVAKYYAPFNLDVVTTRPTQPNYIMCAVGGLPDLIGEPCSNGGCVLGVAPLDCQVDSSGKIYYNDQDDVEVVFAFSDAAKYDPSSYASKINTLAATIAQESAHAYGLGHEANQQDVMNPYATGGSISFTNQASTYADTKNCAKGQGTQNSYQLLMQILGAHQGGGTTSDTTPPTISITAPANSATVGKSFTISMTAGDNVGVDHIDVQLDGPSPASTTLTGSPWTWGASVGSDGTYTITATAYDAAGNQASAARTVSVSSSGGNNGGGMTSGGDVGTACEASSDCSSSQCLDSGSGKYCTQDCSLSDSTSCPDGFVCTDLGADGAHCLVARSKSSSGCAVSPQSDRGSPGLLLLALLAVPALVRRRRAN